MIKFATKSKLDTYLEKLSPKEGDYIVTTDESLGGGQSVYNYTNSKLTLLSNTSDSTQYNWLSEVDTFALIATTHTTPKGLDAVSVKADETKSGQPTWYIYTNGDWAYQGIYFVESNVLNVSDRNTRAEEIDKDTDYTIPFKYVVNKDHLEVFIEGDYLTKGVDYVEIGPNDNVSDKIQFKFIVPKEARLIFRRKIASIADKTIIPKFSKDVFIEYFLKTYSDMDSEFLKSGLKVANNVFNITDDLVTTFTIPAGKPNGYKIKVRKMNTAPSIVISCETTTEKFTKSALPTVSLTSEGDFWEFEKVSDIQWDLIGGYERGSNVDGEFICSADGTQRCEMKKQIIDALFVLDAGSGFKIAGPYQFTYPRKFKAETHISDSPFSKVYTILFSGNLNTDHISRGIFLGVDSTAAVTKVSTEIGCISTGRWY